LARKIVTVDEGLHLPPAVQTQLKSDLEADFTALVTTAQSAAGSAATSASSANTAKEAAEAAASAVLSPSDSQVAGFVNSPSSATRTALDGRYAQLGSSAFATETYVDNAVIALQDQSASIEDLFVSVPLLMNGGVANASVSSPIFIAPFPLAVTSVVLTMWGGGSPIAANDTNYWSVEARVLDTAGTTQRVVATKTTRVSGGQAMGYRQPWSFTGLTFSNQDCVTNEMINIALNKVGTAPDIFGALVATVGYRPL
jgi:hypothetical protein